MLSEKLHVVIFLVVNCQVRITERLLHLGNLLFQLCDFLFLHVNSFNVKTHLLAGLLPLDALYLILTDLVAVEVELLLERCATYYCFHGCLI